MRGLRSHSQPWILSSLMFIIQLLLGQVDREFTGKLRPSFLKHELFIIVIIVIFEGDIFTSLIFHAENSFP